MHSASCLIPASNAQHVELGRVKGRRKEEEEEELLQDLKNKITANRHASKSN
jgi:hypothetical protein